MVATNDELCRFFAGSLRVLGMLDSATIMVVPSCKQKSGKRYSMY